MFTNIQRWSWLFGSRLKGQAALCSWTVDQEKEVVREIFFAKTRYKDIQRELCIRTGNTSEEMLKSAVLQVKGPRQPFSKNNCNLSGGKHVTSVPQLRLKLSE